MKNLFFLFSLISFSAYSMTLEGQVSVDGEDHKFSQAIELGKEYSFKMNTFTYKITLTKTKSEKIQAKFNLFEGNKLVTSGEEMIKEKSEDFYMKGAPGQPNSIITLKVSQ